VGKGDDMSERNGLATRIAQATGIPPEKVCEVVQLALEELHHIMIVDEKGPTAAVMEACFSFGGDAAFHLIGLFVSEHDYHGRDDDAGIWSEVAKRFIPSAYAEGCARIAPWFREKTADRLGLDADIRHSSTSMSKNDERNTDCSSPQDQPQLTALIDPPSPFDTLQTWEQHLAELRKFPDNVTLKQELISQAEEVLAWKRRGRPVSSAAALATGLAKAGQRLIDETNMALPSCGDLARRGSEKPLVVIAGPSKIAGGVSRVVKRPDGSSRVETWEAGIGWLPGGASYDEFMPGACTR
jgi:hypothetical protein